jgi:hypothetical protein
VKVRLDVPLLRKYRHTEMKLLARRAERLCVKPSEDPTRLIEHIDLYAKVNNIDLFGGESGKKYDTLFLDTDFADSSAGCYRKLKNRVEQVSLVDEKVLSIVSKSACSVVFKTKSRSSNIRYSPIPIKYCPMWVRKAFFPEPEKYMFVYFDVVTAEFAHLLMCVNFDKYYPLYESKDIYNYIQHELGINAPRDLVKQFSMAMICGGTYKVAQTLLRMTVDHAKDTVQSFWELFPDVQEHLEQVWMKVKLTSHDLELSNGLALVWVNNFKQEEDFEVFRRKILSTYVRDSFVAYFARYIKGLHQRISQLQYIDKRYQGFAYLWVDCALIPIPITISLNRIQPVFNCDDQVLKLKITKGNAWGDAQESNDYLVTMTGGGKHVIGWT